MKVVSVKFKENGRAYYFDPGEFKIKEGDFVVVTTARGTECGEVVRAAHEVPGFSREVKPVIRVADAVDVRRMRQNRADVQQAYHICEQRIAAHNLKMKLVDAEYTLDRSKLVFYFTADNRVDFRELVKDLASQFHTRIELRQIGEQDAGRPGALRSAVLLQPVFEKLPARVHQDGEGAGAEPEPRQDQWVVRTPDVLFGL